MKSSHSNAPLHKLYINDLLPGQRLVNDCSLFHDMYGHSHFTGEQVIPPTHNLNLSTHM